jgi:hypothetical protein
VLGEGGSTGGEVFHVKRGGTRQADDGRRSGDLSGHVGEAGSRSAFAEEARARLWKPESPMYGSLEAGAPSPWSLGHASPRGGRLGHKAIGRWCDGFCGRAQRRPRPRGNSERDGPWRISGAGDSASSAVPPPPRSPAVIVRQGPGGRGIDSDWLCGGRALQPADRVLPVSGSVRWRHRSRRRRVQKAAASGEARPARTAAVGAGPAALGRRAERCAASGARVGAPGCPR